jgi:hypothetical protein
LFERALNELLDLYQKKGRLWVHFLEEKHKYLGSGYILHLLHERGFAVARAQERERERGRVGK